MSTQLVRPIAAACIVASCFVLAAHAADVDITAGKCLAHPQIVKTIQADFVPTSWPQRILVTRKLNTEPAIACVGRVCHPDVTVFCAYRITWEFLQPTLRTYLEEQSWTYHGPGLAFSNGVWAAQPVKYRLDVAQAHLVGARPQLVIYHEIKDAAGRRGDLAVYDLTNEHGVPGTLLHVRNRGRLTYSFDNGVVDIKGDYFSPDACAACDGVPDYEVKLKFDPGAHQMAIVTPDKRTEMFYKSILVPINEQDHP